MRPSLFFWSYILANYSILVLNGPNLNMLGVREPQIYGKDTLLTLEQRLLDKAKTLGVSLSCKQSNSEGELVTLIQKAYQKIDFILINAGAYTHTSVAIRDALSGIDIPFYEIHISNVHKREPFRHLSYLSDIAVGVIAGFGLYGYELALDAAVKYLEQAHK